MIVKLLISSAITILFFIIFIKLVSLNEILDFLSLVDVYSVVAGFSLYSVSQVVRAVRWNLLLKAGSLGIMFLVSSATIFMNNILPARTGELSWFFYMRKVGYNLSVSAFSLILGRFSDLFGLFFLFLLLYAFEHSVWYGIPVALLFMFWGWMVFKIIMILPAFWKIRDFRQYVERELTPIRLTSVVVLSFISFVCKFIAVLFVIENVFSVDVTDFMLALAGGEITSVMPIHGFLGMGTYEAGFTVLYGIGEIGFREALKLGFISHMFFLLSSSILGILSMLLLHILPSKSP